MTRSTPSRLLKDQNRPQLWLAMAANVVAIYAAAQWTDMTTFGLRGLLNGVFHLLPVGLAVLFTTVATSLIDVETKCGPVFLRWRHALPGHRAFTEYGPRDPRVDMSKVTRLLGNELPSEPGEQNAVWYGLFKQAENEPPVLGAHRDFLLLRDYAALAALFHSGLRRCGRLCRTASHRVGNVHRNPARSILDRARRGLELWCAVRRHGSCGGRQHETAEGQTVREVGESA